MIYATTENGQIMELEDCDISYIPLQRISFGSYRGDDNNPFESYAIVAQGQSYFYLKAKLTKDFVKYVNDKFIIDNIEFQIDSATYDSISATITAMGRLKDKN
jgi:hypothetical protein